MEPLAESLWSCENCDDHNNQNPPADNPCRCCKRGGGSEERYRESRCSILNRVDAVIAEAGKKQAEAEAKLAEFYELLVNTNNILVDTSKPTFELPASKKLGDIMDELKQLRLLKRDHSEIVQRAVVEATNTLGNLAHSLTDRLDLLAPPEGCEGDDDGPLKCLACGHMVVRAWPPGKIDLFKKPPTICPTCILQEHEKYKTALQKIDEIRNSIVGSTTVNWSEHVYPLVAALNEAGFVGIEFVKTREDFGTLAERCRVAEKRVVELENAARNNGDFLWRLSRQLGLPNAEVNDYINAICALQKQIAVLTSHNKALAAGLQNKGVCDESENVELRKRVVELEAALTDSEKERDVLRERVVELNQAVGREIDTSRKLVSELESRNKALAAGLQTVEQERDVLKRDLAVYTRFAQTRRIAELEAALTDSEKERDVLKQSIALKCDGSADKRVAELTQACDDARESANVWSDDYQKLAAQFAKLEAEHARLAVTATDSEKICGILKQRVAELEQVLQREIAISKEHIVELEAKLRSFGISVSCEVRPDVHRDPDGGSELYSNSVEYRAKLGKWLQERFPQRWSSHYNAFGTIEAAMKFLDSVAQVLGRKTG